MRIRILVIIIVIFLVVISSFNIMVISEKEKEEVIGKKNNIGSRDVDDIPWPMFRGNIRRTGLSPYSTCNNSGDLLWKFKTGGAIFSSPAIDSDGTIFIGSNDTYFYAINPSGELKWKIKTGEAIYSSPAISNNGNIYFGSRDHFLYSINQDGTSNWRFQTMNNIDSSPVVDSNGTIYFGSDDGHLYAIYPNGTLKWKYKTEDIVASSPVIGLNGSVYIGSNDAHLYSINTNGTLAWSFKTNGAISSSPAIGSNGTIYFASLNDAFYAINSNGTIKWSHEEEHLPSLSPAIGPDGTIYYVSHTILEGVYPNGDLKWNIPPIIYVEDSSPVVGSKGNIYVGDFYGLNSISSNGYKNWKFRPENRMVSSSAISSNGTLLFGSTDGHVYAIGKLPSVPLPPKSLEVTKGENSISLSWGRPTDCSESIINGYKIYRKTDSENENLLTTLDGTTTFYRDTTALEEKMYYYFVIAMNNIGESNSSNEVSAIIDDIKPIIKIITPIEGAIVPSKFTISGIASDNVMVTTVEIKVERIYDWIVINGTTSWSRDFDLGGGEYNISVRATDIAGNINIAIIKVYSDRTKPYIQFINPSAYPHPDYPDSDYPIVSTKKIKVNGFASDNSGIKYVEISQDGTNWTLIDGTTNWSGNLTLNEGMNRIYVRATDLAGNTNIRSIKIKVETDPGSLWWIILLIVSIILLITFLIILKTKPRKSRQIREKTSSSEEEE